MPLENPDSSRPIAEVVLLGRLDRVFHYSVPEALRDRLEAGMRVLVPFRAEWRTGIVTRRLRRADVAQVKPILEVLDPAPLLDRPMMALARWVSDYYLCGWGYAMKAILPSGLEAAVGRHYRISEAGRKALLDSVRQSKRGRVILTALAAAPRGLRLETLLARIKAAAGPVQDRARKSAEPMAVLVRKGWIEETRRLPRPRRSRPDEEGPPRTPAYTKPSGGPEGSDGALPDELDQAIQSGRFSAVCLVGGPDRSHAAVVAAIRETVRRGRSVIILVPEISRVSDWTERLRERFGDGIGVLHSGLSDRERQTQWQRARRGELAIVVGTRLAVFAPLSKPGLIVVEDEQNPAYKQEESPRYHARDVAVLRAKHTDALVVLTGESPSVETYANLSSGKYRSVSLYGPGSERAAPPAVRIIDLAGLPWGTFVSDDFLSAVTARLEKKDPVVLFLNRRGFGSALYCRDCGVVVRCARCQVAAVYSKQRRWLSCPYCGTSVEIPTLCSGCRGSHLEVVGAGTERVEEFFTARFPTARILRLDRDTLRPGDLKAAIERLNRSEIDLLIGTQLLLNGPRMTRPGLVGLLLADGAFHLPDFRAGEQTFQLISRLMDFSAGGELLLQTHYPTHESIAWAVSGEPKEFYEPELALRKALGYPPFVRLASVIVKAIHESKAVAVAQGLADEIRRSPLGSGLQILGPAAALRPRLRGKFRRQILIKAPDSRSLHEALQSALKAVRSGSGRSRVWIEVDVDPQQIA